MARGSEPLSVAAVLLLCTMLGAMFIRQMRNSNSAVPDQTTQIKQTQTSPVQVESVTPAGGAPYVPWRLGAGVLVPNLLRPGVFLRPAADDLAQIEAAFLQSLQQIDYYCGATRRLGRASDGGWDMCVEPGLNPTRDDCLVYSFGIANDFSFDEDVVKKLRCHVHAFDPSIGKADHVRGGRIHFHNAGLYGTDLSPLLPWRFKRNRGNARWKMFTLKQLRKRLGHTKVTIDMLKFDIEFSELHALPGMVEDGSLDRVGQLAFELHLSPEPTRQDMYWISVLLLQLDLLGFRRWQYAENRHCRHRSQRMRAVVSSCHELYFLNTNFLKKNTTKRWTP